MKQCPRECFLSETQTSAIKRDQGKAYQAKGPASTRKSNQEEHDMCKEQKAGHCSRNIKNKEKQKRRYG